MMKNLVSFFFFLIFMFSSAQIKWMSVEQAIEAQKKNPKKMLIDFYTPDNSTLLMQKKVYAHPFIVKFINEKFYAVKFNVTENKEVNFYGRVFKNSDTDENSSGKAGVNQFAKFMNVNSYPSLVFLDETGKAITNLMGGFTARELEPYISMIGDNAYKGIKTREEWENYQKKFKSKIKE